MVNQSMYHHFLGMNEPNAICTFLFIAGIEPSPVMGRTGLSRDASDFPIIFLIVSNHESLSVSIIIHKHTLWKLIMENHPVFNGNTHKK